MFMTKVMVSAHHDSPGHWTLQFHDNDCCIRLGRKFLKGVKTRQNEPLQAQKLLQLKDFSQKSLIWREFFAPKTHLGNQQELEKIEEVCGSAKRKTHFLNFSKANSGQNIHFLGKSLHSSSYAKISHKNFSTKPITYCLTEWKEGYIPTDQVEVK